MISDKQAIERANVFVVTNDGRVVEYAVREVHRKQNGTLSISCGYGTHWKQCRWIDAADCYATPAEAYRESAAQLRKQAAALLAEADRREREACAPRASDFYAAQVKQG